MLFGCFKYTCGRKRCVKICVSVFKMLKNVLETPYQTDCKSFKLTHKVLDYYKLKLILLLEHPQQ